MRCDLIGVSEAPDNGARVMHEPGLRSDMLLVGIYQDLDITARISLLPDGVMVLFFFSLSSDIGNRARSTLAVLHSTLAELHILQNLSL